MNEVLDGQVSMCDLGMLSTKMFPELLQAGTPKAQTSQRSSKHSSKSRNREPLCMCVYRTEDGPTPGVTTLKMVRGALLGDFTTRGFGESPREENVSLLSQILEGSAPRKYFLSERACTGILTRAKKRGKELPPELKAALERQTAMMPEEMATEGPSAQ